MWYTIVTIIHVLVCFFLAIVVLLQQGKGSDVSAVFGGSSQTLFGSSGAGNLLTKLTSASAIIFMITSLTLTYGAARQSTKSLFDNTPVSTPAPPSTQESQSATTSTETATPQVQVTTEEQSTTTTPSASTSPSPQTSTSSSQPADPQTSPPLEAK